jgi:hypothetical protein
MSVFKMSQQSQPPASSLPQTLALKKNLIALRKLFSSLMTPYFIWGLLAVILQITMMLCLK